MHISIDMQNMSSSASANDTQSDESDTDFNLADVNDNFDNICYITGYNLIFERHLKLESKVWECAAIVAHVKNMGLDLTCTVAALEDDVGLRR